MSSPPWVAASLRRGHDGIGRVSGPRWSSSSVRLRATLAYRAMFGGVGVYADGLCFALMAGDVLYFRVDDHSRPDFEERAMGPLLPYGDPARPMQYYEVPVDLLETPADLAAWVDGALAVAWEKRKAAAQKASKRSRTRPPD